MDLPESSETRRFVRPADYYSTATPDRVLPRWATFGCGAAAIAFLLIIFLGSILISSDSLSGFFDLIIGTSVAELKGQYAADIPPTIRDSFDKEITRMRENLRGGRVSITGLQPFLQAMQQVSSDRRVTAPELDRLTAEVRRINEWAGREVPAAGSADRPR